MNPGICTCGQFAAGCIVHNVGPPSDSRQEGGVKDREDDLLPAATAEELAAMFSAWFKPCEEEETDDAGAED